MEATGFDFSDLCDDAVQRTGGQTATAEDVVKIRRSLRIILERWAALRYNTWRVKKMEIGAGGSPRITLPRDVDDIFQINARSGGVTYADADTESPMTRIGPEQYAQITNKMTRGQPSQYFLNRTEKPELFVYPIGRQGVGDTLDIWYVERPDAYDRYGNDIDAPGRWLEALTCGVALELARKTPREDGTYDEGLIARLKAEADEANLIAQNSDRQRTKYRFRMGGRR